MTENEALSRLLNAKNYRDICPDTVKKEFEEQLRRHPDPAEAEKAARERLHALTGAFMSAGELKQAGKLLERYISGDETALKSALMLHSSTRERIEQANEMYLRVFSAIGKPESVFDAACGLNPLYLGGIGVENVLGADIQGGAVNLINGWAKAGNWKISALCRDLTLWAPEEEFELALVMKLLPVLETARKGGAAEFLSRVRAKRFLITFPTRTLSGRDAGMEKNYSLMFDSVALSAGLNVIDRFVSGSELVYIAGK